MSKIKKNQRIIKGSVENCEDKFSMDPKLSVIGKRSGKEIMSSRSFQNKFCNLLRKMRQVICNFAVSLDGYANVHRPAADIHFKLTRDFAALNCGFETVSG